MFGPDGLFAPKSILLVKWEENVSRLLRDPSVEFIPENVGGIDRRITDTSLYRNSYKAGILAGFRSLFAANGLRTVDSQRRLSDILINWTRSHHQFETEPFSACRPTNRVNPILCGHLRRSEHPADSNIGPCPIRPAHDQFFEAG
jgi:hypothetical protein